MHDGLRLNLCSSRARRLCHILEACLQRRAYIVYSQINFEVFNAFYTCFIVVVGVTSFIMLSKVIERGWPHVLVYLFITSAAWYARHWTQETIAYAILATTTLYYGKVGLDVLRTEAKIDGLGKRAPSVRSHAPFGLDVLAQALWYFSHYRNHEFWWQIFGKFGNPKNPYTVEAITAGQRLVFTADEENIKAILATQFQDFGKGPQFRKEWKDFLGLSMFG